MPTSSELNTLINSLNDKALAWYQTIKGPSITVPGVPTPNIQTQQSATQPSGASTTPSGGTQPQGGQILVLAAVGFAVLFLSFFVARKAKIL